MRIAVCDDNNVFLNQINDILLSWPDRPEQTVVSLFSDGDALISAHHTTPFDVILLDVVMPLLNGIQTARELRESDGSVRIIFLTSSPEFAVDSYTVKASNYLLKPVERDRLYDCLSELLLELQEKAKTITIKGVNIVHRVELERIEYLEAQNKHVLVTMTDGRSFLSQEPLYAFEDRLLLDDGFYKCNRSYIVNIHQIDTYTRKEIQMHSGCKISISRKCQHDFEAAYFSAIFRKAGDMY